MSVVECGEPGCCDGTCPFVLHAEGREVSGIDSRWGENRMVKFTPARMDDLRPMAAEHVGRTFEVYFSGTMDEGPYAGQTIWEPVDGTIWFGWIPECDLTDAS